MPVQPDWLGVSRMALIRIDHAAQSVQQSLPVYLIVPDPGQLGQTGPQSLAGRPVLFLLHGLGEDGSAWIRKSQIDTLAEQLGLVVVAPSCGRSFYADLKNGQAWFRYLTEELPTWLKSLFHLTLERERTFIAGSSMGGYGAIKAALLRPGAFAAAASFSGVLSLDIIHNNLEDERRIEFEQLFGNLDDLPGSRHDPMVWLQQADPSLLPRLLVSCGTEDELYPLSRQFLAASEQAGVPVTWHEEAGGHDWIFWNRQLSRFLSFALPGQAAQLAQSELPVQSVPAPPAAENAGKGRAE